MSNHTKLVSILLPVCNNTAYLESCLKSLLDQTYDDIEIIAIDDDSRDTSWSILRSYAKLDRRLKISRNKKRYGLGITLNRAVKKARGRFIAFMNANDLSSLNRIKRQVKYLLDHPKIVAVGTQRVLLNDRNKRLEKSTYPLTHDEVYLSLVTGATIQYESLMIDRLLLPKDLIKFSNHRYPLVFSELIVKLIQYGKIANMNQHLYYHRTISLQKIHAKHSSYERKLSIVKLWLKSIAMYDYRPNAKVIFQPLINPVKTIFR